MFHNTNIIPTTGNIDRIATHTRKPYTFHSRILPPAGAIRNMGSVGQPGKSPSKNAGTTCYNTRVAFLCLFYFAPLSQLKGGL